MPRWKNVVQSSDELYWLKRRAVLREAMRIIGRRGYHRASLDDVAAALQVSKGTLYNYIADKQEILFECHMMALAIGDAAFDFAEAYGRSAYGRLRLMLRAYVHWMNDAAGGGGVGTELGALRDDDREVVIGRRDRAQARMLAYFDQGRRDGSLAATDARLAVYTIMGAINMVPTWYSPGGRLDLDTIARRMTDLLLDAIAREPDKAAIDAIAIPPFDAAALPVRSEREGAAERPRAVTKPRRPPAASRRTRAATPRRTRT